MRKRQRALPIMPPKMAKCAMPGKRFRSTPEKKLDAGVNRREQPCRMEWWDQGQRPLRVGEITNALASQQTEHPHRRRQWSRGGRHRTAMGMKELE